MNPPLYDFKQGVKASWPIAITFFCIFTAVGAACKQAGLTLGQSLASTVFVFAAPAQFVLLEYIHDATLVALVIAILVINFRFFIMASALLPYFKNIRLPHLVLSSQLIAASTFSVSYIQFSKDKPNSPFHYFLGVAAGSCPLTLLATITGFIAMEQLPSSMMANLSLIMPLYFATLLARSWPQLKLVIAGLMGFFLTPVANLYWPGYGLIVASLSIACLLFLCSGRTDHATE